MKVKGADRLTSDTFFLLFLLKIIRFLRKTLETEESRDLVFGERGEEGGG